MGVVMESQPANRQPLLSELEPQFRHEIQTGLPSPSTALVQSFCTHCHKYIAASDNPALLAKVEQIHQCDVPVRSYPPAA